MAVCVGLLSIHACVVCFLRAPADNTAEGRLRQTNEVAHYVQKVQERGATKTEPSEDVVLFVVLQVAEVVVHHRLASLAVTRWQLGIGRSVGCIMDIRAASRLETYHIAHAPSQVYTTSALQLGTMYCLNVVHMHM